MTYRVFLDANVLIEAVTFWTPGDPQAVPVPGRPTRFEVASFGVVASLVDPTYATSAGLRLATSTHVLTMTRGRLREKFGFTDRAIDNFLGMVVDAATIDGAVCLESAGMEVGQPGDPEDWRVLWDAEACGASILVTSDSRLLLYLSKDRKPPPIGLNPREYLERIQSRAPVFPEGDPWGLGA